MVDATAASVGQGSRCILVTGATGLLGRPTFRALCRWADDQSAGSKTNAAFRVVGTGWSRVSCPTTREKLGLGPVGAPSAGRTGHELVALDITDNEKVHEMLDRLKPAVVVHCAAERRPDQVEHHPEKAEAINVTGTESLATASRAVGAFFIYISTDYVFDGSSPPYSAPSLSSRRPLQAYGRMKAAGEDATIRVFESAASEWTILRVPVLFGPSNSLDESSVTVTLRDALNGRPAQQKVNAWQIRFPTYTKDVAEAIVDLVRAREARCTSVDSSPCGSKDSEPAGCGVARGAAGVHHFSGEESVSKFSLAKLMLGVLGVEASHLVPDHDAPQPSRAAAGGASRPVNCQLDCAEFDQWRAQLESTFPRGGVTTVRTTLQKALEDTLAGERLADELKPMVAL